MFLSSTGTHLDMYGNLFNIYTAEIKADLFGRSEVVP
jgi:hypothetical protein